MDAASRRIKEEKDLNDFYEKHKHAHHAFVLMDLSPENIEEYKILFPNLVFEPLVGCIAVTIRN